MSTPIKYYTKEVYGKTMYYLANADARVQWRGLTGKKTITSVDMTLLTNMTGVTFDRVFEAEA